MVDATTLTTVDELDNWLNKKQQDPPLQQRLQLVQFSAPWCHLCPNMKQKLLDIAVDDGPIDIAHVNTPDAEDLVEKMEVSRLPLVLVFAAGEIAARVTGLDFEALTQALTMARWQLHGVAATETDF